MEYNKVKDPVFGHQLDHFDFGHELKIEIINEGGSCLYFSSSQNYGNSVHLDYSGID